ncbi:TetR/AcrR family transcriptional regulator [Conexibacter sp. CPCC 206217]|uniref:TetR/AcrR family transcriptional regulator n=1 Tax=Conexibacter sp. CPCC 206217 TaxID=3064574 RepID=UPI00272080F5|nr:TetR/AcrR family transcriptional regulator [Conexibacter sp. CPCC 206217]MDO8212623.1 TetR/AcrR family transcriptional regulator [Conexibacter sp. CPCC 206217]
MSDLVHGDDPRQRLHDVDEAARRVIVRKGLGATTLRDISREGGFTTGLLTHYFADKQALIFGVFSSASDRWIGRVRSSLGAVHTVEEQLCVIVELCVPKAEEDQLEWRLWSEMWTYAGWNAEFAAYLIETDALWENELRAVIERAVQEEVLPADLDAAEQARIIGRLVDGLGVRTMLNGRWDEARGTLVAHLTSLGLAPRVVRVLNGIVATA